MNLTRDLFYVSVFSMAFVFFRFFRTLTILTEKGGQDEKEDIPGNQNNQRMVD